MHTHFCHTVFIFTLCILLVSCGPAPQGERMPIPSATRSQPASTSAPTATRTASATGALPSSAEIDVTKKPLLKALFRTELEVNRLEDVYAMTRGKIQNLSIVSNCDLEMLKAFVATGWAPVIRSRRSSKGHLSVIMGYDDADQKIQIGNPLSTSKKRPGSRVGRTLTYSEFKKEWSTGSGNKCVLVTPRRLHDVEIHAALKKFLPEEQVDRVQVRSR